MTRERPTDVRAFLLRVSAQSVLNCLRTFAQEHYEKLEPTSRAIILELDERWHDLKQKRRKLWIWKALDRDTGQRLDWECGRRDKATLKQLVDRLLPRDVKMYGTDKWATYASVIPRDTLVQSNAMTPEIERHHGRQRHWVGEHGDAGDAHIGFQGLEFEDGVHCAISFSNP